jgi:hypothetical protein
MIRSGTASGIRMPAQTFTGNKEKQTIEEHLANLTHYLEHSPS